MVHYQCRSLTKTFVLLLFKIFILISSKINSFVQIWEEEAFLSPTTCQAQMFDPTLVQCLRKVMV